MDLAAKIRRLEDIEDIKQFKARWCETFDAALGVEKGVAFFADDGVVDVERYGRHQGRAALIKFFSQMPFTFMFHCLIPKVIEIGHDGLSARGQFRLWELATKPAAAAGDAATPVWVGGEYDDDFIKVGGEWKIKTMRLRLSFITPFDQGWVKKPFAD
jgi:hypothetical protein